MAVTWKQLRFATDVVPVTYGGTGATSAADARANLGAAAKGANSDITSLSGLTTALSLAQGGTGGTTAPAALAALGGVAAVGGTLTDARSVSAVITMNPSFVAADFTVPSYYNAYSAGPLTIRENVSVTLGDFSNWSVL